MHQNSELQMIYAQEYVKPLYLLQIRRKCGKMKIMYRVKSRIVSL